MTASELITAPFRAMIAVPVLAFLPAVLLTGAGLWERARAPRLVLWVGLLWMTYAMYESAVWFGGRVDGDDGANIRADMLLIAPMLAIGTVAAVWAWLRHLRASHEA